MLVNQSMSVPALISRPDNTPGAIEDLQTLNAYYRVNPWPAEFRRTQHQLFRGDARTMPFANESVHLVVTSPPYWTLKEYRPSRAQLGAIAQYSDFLDQLDRVWQECFRVLVPGGRICCVVGDVCVSRKTHGRHHVLPLHADILVRARNIGFDSLTPILWFKIANGSTEVEGNGAGFYGKPYQPGAIVKNDFEYILFLRKPGEYRSPTNTQKVLSMLTRDEMQGWLRTAWSDIKGESTKKGHPAPYPPELAERLIRLFSFAGDCILDPFSGTASTSLAALWTGRNSIGIEVERLYHELAQDRLEQAIRTLHHPACFEPEFQATELG